MFRLALQSGKEAEMAIVYTAKQRSLEPGACLW